MASDTLTADGVAATTAFPNGVGYLYLTGDFGTGNLVLELRLEDGSWGTVATYTAAPDPNPVALDFGGASVRVRCNLSSSTSPDLYCQLTAGVR